MDAERLQEFLAAVEPERGATVISLEPIPGGYSRDTHRAQVRWADGSIESFVLRSDPAIEESVFRSDRDREWTLLNALATVPTFRIPQPRYYDSTGEYLGTKCIISEAVPSVSVLARLQDEPDLDTARRQFAEMIASVHTASLDSLAETVERPLDWRSHLESLLAAFDRIIAAEQESDPVLRYVRRKLRANLPPEVPLTLVHGDYNPGNFLLPEDGSEPVLIDWEFGHVGDPRQDLGYYLQVPMPPHLYHSDPEGFCAIYRELTGLSREQVNPDVIDYFLVLGSIHLMEQIHAGAEDVAQGQHRGIMGTYLLIAIAHFNSLFFNVAKALPPQKSESHQ